jgi:hypothetical protein
VPLARGRQSKFIALQSVSPGRLARAKSSVAPEGSGATVVFILKKLASSGKKMNVTRSLLNALNGNTFKP